MKLFTTLMIVIAGAFMTIDGLSKSDYSDSTQQKVLKVDTTNFQKDTIDQSKWYEHKSMPWIASLVIAVLTVIVNLTISYSTRKTSLKVVKSQIESSVNLATVQFHSTLNSKNRQDWINEVRNCISEFATHVRQLNIELQEKNQDKERTFAVNEKVYLYRSKIKLLLSPKIVEHLTFLNALEDLMNILEIHLLNSRSNIGNYNNQDFMIKSDILIEKGRELLYFEWQKIQNAKFRASDS